MNLELSEQQAFFQETTRRFLTSEAPLSLVRHLHPSDDGFDRAWWRRGADLGWTSLLAPEEHGGGSLSGRPVADAAIVAEELGRMVSPGPFLCTNLAVAALTSWGSGQQQATWLPPLVTGDTIGSWALAEPGSRWDVTDITTEATVDGDDIVVHGTKAYVEAAPVADVFVVVARTQRG